MLLLLSAIVLSQNHLSIPIVYADKNADMADQLTNLGTNKASIQQVLKKLQTEIVQTSGQDKATNAIKQLKSVIELYPNGPLAQSLLILAKQQAAGNTDFVNQTLIQVAERIGGGSDNVANLLEQAVAPFASPASSQGVAAAAVTTTPPPSNTVQQPAQQFIQQQTLITSSLPTQSTSSSLSSPPPSSPLENDIPQVTNNTNTSLNSGPDLIVNSGSFVTLDGSSSHSTNGNPIPFTWMQIAGPPVMLSGANTINAAFTAPTVSTDTTMLFKLTVTDQNGLSDSKTVQIRVIPIATATSTTTSSLSSASSSVN